MDPPPGALVHILCLSHDPSASAAGVTCVVEEQMTVVVGRERGIYPRLSAQADGLGGTEQAGCRNLNHVPWVDRLADLK